MAIPILRPVSRLEERQSPQTGRTITHLFFRNEQSSKIVEKTFQTGVIGVGYKLGDRRGRGPFSDVIKAKSLSTHIIVALKIVDKRENIGGADFRRELAKMISLRPPNITDLPDYKVSDGFSVIAMQLVEGGRTVKYVVLEKSELGENDARFIRRLLVPAIVYCHDHGISHRVIKLESI